MRKPTLIVLLLFSICSYAQTSKSSSLENGTLFFKDGTQKSGIITIDGLDILFRKDENSEEKFYNFNSVNKFNIENKNGSLRNYHYELIVKNNNKTKVILIDESKDKGIIFFKNKTQKSGILKIKGSKVKFKKDQDSKEEIYDFNSIYKLNVQGDNGEIDEYEYKLVVKENKTKVFLLKSVIIGNVSLYSLTNSYTINDPNFGLSSGLYTAYYLSKKDDLYATKILPPNIYNYHFRKNIAPIFFGKCKELMEIINDKTFEKYDFEKVVNYYNKECNN